MSKELAKMNLISVVQQLPKKDIEIIQGYVEMIEEQNQELKKQLEELKQTNKVLSEELTKDKILKQDCLTTCCGIPIGDIPKLINQQKEFIKYLEDEIEHNTPRARWKHYNEDGLNDYDVENGDYLEAQPVNITLKEVISKYQEIIGGK